jgi:hypothetical protein
VGCYDSRVAGFPSPPQVPHKDPKEPRVPPSPGLLVRLFAHACGMAERDTLAIIIEVAVKNALLALLILTSMFPSRMLAARPRSADDRCGARRLHLRRALLQRRRLGRRYAGRAPAAQDVGVLLSSCCHLTTSRICATASCGGDLLPSPTVLLMVSISDAKSRPRIRGPGPQSSQRGGIL